VRSTGSSAARWIDVRADDRDPVHEGYLRAVECFSGARDTGVPMSSGTFLIADRRVAVTIAGPALASAFTSPWTHLRDDGTDGRDADLRVDLWHERETQVAPPDVDDGIDLASRFPFRPSADDRFLAHRQPETRVWLDRKTRHLVGAVRDVDRRALYEAGRPIELQILVWLRDAGVPLVHASFVALDGRGALIVGRSGSGKSTLAARCVAEGFQFLSDDKIAVTRSDAGFTGHSLTSSLHVDRGTLRRVPALAPHATAPSLALDDKFRIAVEQWSPGRLARSARISAVIVPSLEAGAGGGGIRPVSKRDALLALSLSTLLSLPIAANRSLASLGDLIERVPAFRIDLNPEADSVARVASTLV
jgi:hypothetical protein